jgi:hypothetical protein
VFLSLPFLLGEECALVSVFYSLFRFSVPFQFSLSGLEGANEARHPYSAREAYRRRRGEVEAQTLEGIEKDINALTVTREVCEGEVCILLWVYFILFLS